MRRGLTGIPRISGTVSHRTAVGRCPTVSDDNREAAPAIMDICGTASHWNRACRTPAGGAPHGGRGTGHHRNRRAESQAVGQASTGVSTCVYPAHTRDKGTCGSQIAKKSDCHSSNTKLATCVSRDANGVLATAVLSTKAQVEGLKRPYQAIHISNTFCSHNPFGRQLWRCGSKAGVPTTCWGPAEWAVRLAMPFLRSCVGKSVGRWG